MNTDTLKQAVVQRAVAAIEQIGPASLTRVHHTAYLLQQAAGIPTSFRFRTHYGSPNSEDLQNTVSLLKTLGYLDTRPTPRPHELDTLVTVTDAPNPQWAEHLYPYDHTISQTLSALHTEDDRAVNMIASSHLIAAILQHRAKTQSAPSPTPHQVARTLQRIKTGYPLEEILQAYRKSRDLPKLPPPTLI